METFSLNWNNSREERSYLAKGWSTDNCLNKCKTPIFINYIDPTRPPKKVSLSLKIFECVLTNLNLCKSTLQKLAGLFFWWKKCLLGFPAREKCLNWSPIVSNKHIPKNPEQFPKNPGIKIWGKSRPGKSRDELPWNAGHCCWHLTPVQGVESANAQFVQ